MSNISLPKNPTQAKGYLMFIGGLVLIVILAVYLQKTFGGIGKALGGLGEGLGIFDSEDAKKDKEAVAAAKEQSSQDGSFWNPNYYKTAPAGARLLTVASANGLASDIWDSVWLFGTRPDELIAAFKQLKAKTQVSFLADRFYQKYNKDLFSWITLQYTKMGKPQTGLTTVITFVNSLPNS